MKSKHALVLAFVLVAAVAASWFMANSGQNASNELKASGDETAMNTEDQSSGKIVHNTGNPSDSGALTEQAGSNGKSTEAAAESLPEEAVPGLISEEDSVEIGEMI